MKSRIAVLVLSMVALSQGCIQVDPNGDIERQRVFHYKGDAISVTFAKGGDGTVPSLVLVEVFNVLTTKTALKKNERFSSIMIKSDDKIVINTLIAEKPEKKETLDLLISPPSSSSSKASGRVFKMIKKNGKWCLGTKGTWFM
jgi:hypothetical protein